MYDGEVIYSYSKYLKYSNNIIKNEVIFFILQLGCNKSNIRGWLGSEIIDDV